MVTIWTQEYARKPKQEEAEEVKEVLKEQEPPEGEVITEIVPTEEEIKQNEQIKPIIEQAQDPQDPLSAIKDLPFKDLRKVAIEQKVEGWQKMKQPELIAAIEAKITEAQEDFTEEEELPFDEEPGEDAPY